MKVRALCAAVLLALAAVPATATAGTSISKRLQRADRALDRAQDAFDEGDDARVVSGLRGATRQTTLALRGTLRLVARDRRDAHVALEDTADQLDSNAVVAMDLTGGASSTVVAAINTTLAAVDTGRGQILTTVQGLGDLEADYADALVSLAGDAVTELAVAAENYDGELSADGDAALTAFVTHEVDAAGAIVAEVARLVEDGDAELDADALDELEADVEDAALALGEVTTEADAAALDAVVAKLADLGAAVSALIGDDYGYDEGYWDEEGYDEEWSPADEDWHPGPPPPPPAEFAHGYMHGYADAILDWAWFARGHGYRGWHDEGFRPPPPPPFKR